MNLHQSIQEAHGRRADQCWLHRDYPNTGMTVGAHFRGQRKSESEQNSGKETLLQGREFPLHSGAPQEHRHPPMQERTAAPSPLTSQPSKPSPVRAAISRPRVARGAETAPRGGALRLTSEAALRVWFKCLENGGGARSETGYTGLSAEHSHAGPIRRGSRRLRF